MQRLVAQDALDHAMGGGVAPQGQQRRQMPKDVRVQLDADPLGGCCLDRRAEALGAFGLAGPDAGEQPITTLGADQRAELLDLDVQQPAELRRQLARNVHPVLDLLTGDDELHLPAGPAH
ncbi:MAG: hypothetical protein JWO26_2818 [Rhodospirillales bacterium]|jgi:hypothetical protein|nr:hypothetical protein [Rhodospirillales bacterium]